MDLKPKTTIHPKMMKKPIWANSGMMMIYLRHDFELVITNQHGMVGFENAQHVY